MNTAQNNTNIEFLFKIPEFDQRVDTAVNIILAMGALASRMSQELRTRTIHPDGRRENVAEHSYMLAKVAVALADELYPWMDRGKIALYALCHDDTEAYVGDTPTDIIANHDANQKAHIEALGTQQLSDEYTPIAPLYVEDVISYESQQDYESQFVRIVDKMTVLLIHIPNDGSVIKDSYSYEQFIESTRRSENTLLEQYPHFIELITLRTELAHYVWNKYGKAK